tara:strand:+ start:2178 stop:3050 length:873 start_codon:yes stop_codon:yes gene_type:complete
MKITNVLNLPQPIVDAVSNDPYDSGASDISVTRIIAPPRIVALTKTHNDEIVEDCSDRLFSLMGQAMHHILERGGDVEGERIIEKRLFAEVDGWTISGQLDIWENGVLSDYKFTSTYETMNGLKDEKAQQLNILAWLCRQNDIEVTKVQIVAMYRDYSKTTAKRERDYPQHQIGVIEAPLWSDEDTLAFIRERLAMHRAAETELPQCSDEDVWQRPSKWAVMQENRVKAWRLLNTKQEALEWCAKNNKIVRGEELKAGMYLEHRPGAKIRCEDYCSVAQFCTQFHPNVSQ